jgi:hypothetical protein
MLICAAAAATGAAAVAGLLLVPAASATSARRLSGPLPSTNGTTTVTTTSGATHQPSDGIGNTLIFAGIMPTAIAPARDSLLGAGLLFPNPGGFSSQFRFTLPVVAGGLGPHSLTGTVAHSGGILFSDRHSLLQVTHMVVHLKSKVMTGILTAEPGFRSLRITLFRLDLSHARIRPGKNDVRAVGIGLHVTKAAAAALDRVLSTKIFTAGLKFGTATIVADDVQGVS